MQVVYAFLANYAEFSSEGKLNVIGGDIDSLVLPTLPYVYPLLNLALKLSFPPDETGTPIPFVAEILDPEGRRIGQPIAHVLTVPLAPDPDAAPVMGIVLAFHQCPFAEAGLHLARLRVLDDPVVRLPLMIRRR